MNNFKKITGHLYTARNQNGFNNALYDYFGEETSYTKKEIREMIQNHPTIYPTAFVIVDMTFECNRMYIETFDLDWEGHFHDIF